MEFLYGGGVMLCFVVFCVCVWRGFNSVFPLLLPFLYGYVTVFISCVYIELFPSEIYEQGVRSYFNGSSFLLFLVLFFSIISVVFVFQMFFKRFALSRMAVRPLLSVNFLAFVALLEIALILHVMISGSPLFNPEVTKFSFWSERAMLKWLSVFNWLLYSILFVVGSSGAYFLYNRGWLARALSFVVFLLACFYYVSWGNKFSALVFVVFSYFIPGVVSYRFRVGSNFPVLRRSFFVGVLFLSVVGFLVWLQYERFQSRGLDVKEQLFERVLVLQGHVWWGAVNHVVSTGGDYLHILAEFKSTVGGGEAGEAGMSYIMKRLAPPDLFYSYVESGVEFTGGYPAVAIMTLGFVGGALFSMFVWGVFGVFLFYLWGLIYQGSRVRLLLAAYIYITSLAWFQHGTISGFINWKFIVVVMGLFFLDFLGRRIFLGFKGAKGALCLAVI